MESWLVWWTLLSLVTLVAFVLIGMRRWFGWAVFALANVLWVIYSVIYDDPALVQVVNVAFVAVGGYFAYAWRKAPLVDAKRSM